MVRGGGEDRRLSPRPLVKLGAVGGGNGHFVWRTCRALVLAATRGYYGSGATTRRVIADLLETTPGVLDRMMAPTDVLMFRADHLHALMTAETIVPEEARVQAAAEIAREWGFTVQPIVPGDELQAQAAALGLAAAAGRTAGLVQDAHADGVMDAAEASEITAAAMAVQREAGAVMQAVEAKQSR